MDRSPEPPGFRLDAGLGKSFDLIHAADRAPRALRYIQQAFLSFKPPQARGLQPDFGQFTSSAGQEEIETHNNWNYSRSLLFTCAVPYYHFGLRATMPVRKNWSAGLQLVNGWNNVKDNNSGKTLGLTAESTSSKVSWSQAYYMGPEKDRSNPGWRYLYDTEVELSPGRNTRLYLNFDYGAEKEPGGGRSRWLGVASAAQFSLARWFAVSPRLEWFQDAGGLMSGTAQTLKEFTLTGEFKIVPGILTRLEYRRDWSNRPFFPHGATPGASRNQDTLLAGFIACFGCGK